MYKLGIDVGGTNTDAVLLDEQARVIADVKQPTSENIHDGILLSIRKVLAESKVDPAEIGQAMLGTTQCTNAIVERKNLVPVGLLRIGAPATLGILPMTDWTEDIRAIVAEQTIVGGGYEYDGSEISPLDEVAVRDFFESIREKVQSIAISCCYSTVRNEQEYRAAQICREVMGNDIHITVSCEIGSMGLIERENAAILNAALYKVAIAFTDGFAKSLQELGIVNADIYLSQNDGTLMTMENARRYPILTIACGPTNSIRGAGYLTGQKNALVIDVGGTTTDLGVIQNGFPRESSIAATIGGVRTNFRMPDVLTIGLGGGSIVREHEDGSITVGPDSVGYQISEKAKIFGGDILTATDVAVRLGMYELGNPELVQDISEEFAEKVLSVIKKMAEDAVDAMKISNTDVDVIVVGGGSIILPDQLEGASKVQKPEHFGTANAIGSAISKVSGVVEKLIDFDKIPREEALRQIKEEALELAVKEGAVRETVEIIDVEEVPLAYTSGHTSRVKVKAAGELQTGEEE